MSDPTAPVEQPVAAVQSSGTAPSEAVPAAEVAVAPADNGVLVSPVVEAPAPAEAVSQEPAPASEGTAAEGERPSSLLSEATADEPTEKKEAAETEPKPAEQVADPAQPDPNADPAQPETPQRLDPLSEYKYELPETLQFSDEQRTSFHSAVEDARNGDLQPLINMHQEALASYDKAASQRQWDAWNKTLDEWRQQTEADEHVGGRNLTGVQRRVAQMRDNYVSRHERGSEGWKADMAAFNHMLDSTGVGNHPALWRFLDNVSRFLSEGAAPAIVDPKPAPMGRRGPSVLYTHDRSPGNGRA